jgi:hypothetical protein
VYAAGVLPVDLAIRLCVAGGVETRKAVVHLERAIHLFYEARARGRAVVGGEGGRVDISWCRDASWGKGAVELGRRDGSLLLGDGAERQDGNCERRRGGESGRAIAFGRCGEMQSAVATSAPPEQQLG